MTTLDAYLTSFVRISSSPRFSSSLKIPFSIFPQRVWILDCTVIYTILVFYPLSTIYPLEDMRAPASRPPWESRSQTPHLERNELPAGKLSGSDQSNVLTDFEFVNESRTPQRSFHLFEGLPLELRRHIWGFSLPHNRLIKVTIAPAESKCDPTRQSGEDVLNETSIALYQTRNNLGNIISGSDYCVHLRSTCTQPPLLYVNREANAVVHDIYRVQIPITHRTALSTAPCLRFCPERDTMLIMVERDEDKVYFAHFVHDVLAYDPKKKGIRHMGITGNGDINSKIKLPIGEMNPTMLQFHTGT